MKWPVVGFILIASLLVSNVHAAQESTTESDRDRAVRYTRALEQRPLDPMAPQMRAWLIGWLEQTSEVTVLVCDILGPIPGKELHFGPELLVQYMAGNGAFQLQNPESMTDPVKPQFAGIANMLLAYQAASHANPKARIPLYDEWMAKQAKGLLESEREGAIREHCSTLPSSQASGTGAIEAATTRKGGNPP